MLAGSANSGGYSMSNNSSRTISGPATGALDRRSGLGVDSCHCEEMLFSGSVASVPSLAGDRFCDFYVMYSFSLFEFPSSSSVEPVGTSPFVITPWSGASCRTPAIVMLRTACVSSLNFPCVHERSYWVGVLKKSVMAKWKLFVKAGLCPNLAASLFWEIPQTP